MNIEKYSNWLSYRLIFFDSSESFEDFSILLKNNRIKHNYYILWWLGITWSLIPSNFSEQN